MILVDSSGWLEYLTDGKNADKFAKVIEDQENLVVSVINIYEIYKKILLERDENSAIQAAALMSQANVIELSQSISLSAAEICAKEKIPMADSMILATARFCGAELWTQDKDFEGLTGVKYIKK